MTLFVERLAHLARSRVLRAAVLICLAAGLVALALTWRPAIEPEPAPDPGSFPREQVARGAALATLGDCAVCHTAEGGPPLAGGRALATPFGTLYSDNLTPDPETGIGRWSAKAFRRAMTDGVSRNGAHLYPALPYEHYTHVRSEDLDALYAYFMTRRPVRRAAPANRLIPPLNFRPLLAGWKLLYLHKGPAPSDPAKSADWNRGAYLVEGLGHCGGCHTPRNLAGGEEGRRAYSGGVAEGWRAPALDASNPAARRWTVEALHTYLRTGLSLDHSAAGGPMGPVVEGLASAADGDVRAIAVYVASKMGRPGAEATAAATPSLTPGHAARAAHLFPEGATLFEGACAGCHGAGAPMMDQARPGLALASNLRDDDPTSAIQAVLSGIEPPVAGRGPKMPPFADSLTDPQIAAVLGFVRARDTDRPPWPQLVRAVRRSRRESVEP